MENKAPAQKLHLHMHFGAHRTSSHFEPVKKAFEKYGPFDIFSPENAISRASSYHEDNIENNLRGRALRQFVREEAGLCGFFGHKLPRAIQAGA